MPPAAAVEKEFVEKRSQIMSKKKNSCGVYAQQAEREARELADLNGKTEDRLSREQALWDAERRGERRGVEKANAEHWHRMAQQEMARAHERAKRRSEALSMLIFTAAALVALFVCVRVAAAEWIITEATARSLQLVLIFAACFACGWLLCDMKRNK